MTISTESEVLTFTEVSDPYRIFMSQGKHTSDL